MYSCYNLYKILITHKQPNQLKAYMKLVRTKLNTHIEDHRYIVMVSIACALNDLATIMWCIQNCRFIKYWKYLTVAIENGHIRILKYLIWHGVCDISVSFVPELSNQQSDLLGYAAYCGHIHVIKFLLSVGLIPSDKDNAAIKVACSEGQLRVVKYFHKHGYNPVARWNFSKACMHGHIDVVRYLIKLGCDPQEVLPSTMATTIYNGHLEMVKLLLQYGHKPDIDRLREDIKYCPIEKYKHILNYLVTIGYPDLLFCH